MSRLYNTFDFVGNISIPKEEKFHKIDEFDSGWVRHTLNFAVKESDYNAIFVELQGGYSKSKANKVYTLSKATENNPSGKLEVSWDDRLDEKVVDMVADFKKIVVDFTTDPEVKKEANKLRYQIRDLEYKENKNETEIHKLVSLKKEYKELVPERYEFIHAFDAVVFLQSHLPIYKDHKFSIKGNVEMSEYNGNFYRKFVPTTIEIVPDDTPSRLRATFDIFFTKDSLKDKVATEKRIHINGYIISYDNNVKKDQFFPMEFVINASKIDFNNEKQVSLLNLLKNKFKVNDNKVYHLPWEVNIYRGAEKKEFTINDLTPEQKELVKFGLNKVEDFAPKGGLLGDPIYENRLVKPLLKTFDTKENNFVNGAVATDYKPKDLVFVRSEKETQKYTTKQEKVENEEQFPGFDVKLDDLFS